MAKSSGTSYGASTSDLEAIIVVMARMLLKTNSDDEAAQLKDREALAEFLDEYDTEDA